MSSASDEWLGDVADGQYDLASHNVLEEVVLAEVLGEPARAHDRERRARVADGFFGALGLRFAAAREQHEPADVAVEGEPRERVQGLDRAGDGYVREVRDVGGADAVEGWCPRRRMLPVERRIAGAGSDADGMTERSEAARDTAAGLPVAAEDQCGMGC
jgi:hypothetical protein